MSEKYDVDYIAPKKDNVDLPKFEPVFKTYTGIISKYDAKYCKEIIEYAQKGGSVESFPSTEHIDPDAMLEWYDEHDEFHAAVGIAMACETSYWEQYSRFAQSNILYFKDILPTINRKLSMLESTLGKNGLRKRMYNYEEPDKISKDLQEDADALQEMENL